MSSARTLVDDALSIWLAGVESVKPARLIRTETEIEGDWLRVCDHEIDLREFDRIVVVGAGKASAPMATALWEHCLSKLTTRRQVLGWINAPEGSFEPGSAGPIVLHAARPAGANEPTEAAVLGTQRVVELVEAADSRTLCLVLLSGGGSAILVSPIEGIDLSDKQHVARRVAAAGGNIQQLNTIRRALSRIKGGGLARNCRAGCMVSMILSDVLGDPLETIASGPTVSSAHATPQQALQALGELGLLSDPSLERVVQVLNNRARAASNQASSMRVTEPHRVMHVILGNNATAVDAAGVRAVDLGYRYVMESARSIEGDVSELAKRCAAANQQVNQESQVDCWISGGEPTVRLPDRDQCGRGGRNQQLVLLTMLEMARRGWPERVDLWPNPGIFLSAGTDGEDGPTDAAGAWFDERIWERAQSLGLNPEDFAARADAYTFFDRVGGLIRSGPTGTNVCDLRIALAPRA